MLKLKEFFMECTIDNINNAYSLTPASPIPPDPISNLPVEIALIIFEYLNIKDLAQISSVNRKWQALTENESLWHSLCIRDFALEEKIKPTVELGVPFAETWKYSYQSMKMGYGLKEIHIDDNSRVRLEGLFKNDLLQKGKRTYPDRRILETSDHY
jgi:hypothetical protein